MFSITTFFRGLDWRSPLGSVMLFVLILLGAIVFYLIGPMPALAYGIQYWASRSSWDWKDRWASVRGSAVFFGLLFLLLCAFVIVPFPLFRETLHTFWGHIRLLGAFSLWPLVPATLSARWLLSLPLAPALALLIEDLHPETHSSLKRVLLPSEKAQIQKQQAEAAQQAAVEAAHVIPSTPSEPKPKQKRTTDQPKRPKKSLYPKKPTIQQQAMVQGEETEETAKQDAEQSPSAQQVPAPKPKVDWTRVRE